MRIVAATTNRGKANEIAAILACEPALSSLELLTLDEAGAPNFAYDESAPTFAENAAGKAVNAALVTGLPAIADDSGLCIDALNGAPGVRSARWLGTSATDVERSEAILLSLEGVPKERRTARFVCAVAVALPNGKNVVAEGTCNGIIAFHPQGNNGFGYDPIFFVPRLNRTMAELTADDKNALSHRGAALRAIAHRMAELLLESA